MRHCLFAKSGKTNVTFEPTVQYKILQDFEWLTAVLHGLFLVYDYCSGLFHHPREREGGGAHTHSRQRDIATYRLNQPRSRFSEKQGYDAVEVSIFTQLYIFHTWNFFQENTMEVLKLWVSETLTEILISVCFLLKVQK